jgi:NAD(P)-dependent dehydrogenase (short-subunit alcohol dehydrogenase family)
MNSYANSKLANVLFSNELARRYRDRGVVSNSLHPGVVKTQIGRKGTNSIIGTIWNLFAYMKGISEEDGAKTSVYLASDPEAGNFTGKYFDLSKEKRPSRFGRDEELAKRLWEKSEELVGEKFD